MLCACLIFNLIGGAPQDSESAKWYVISVIGFSAILSIIFGNWMYRLFSKETPEEDDSYQASLSKLVSAYEEGKLTESEKEELRSLLSDMEK